MSTKSQPDPRTKYRDFNKRPVRVHGLEGCEDDDDLMAAGFEPDRFADCKQKGEAP
jgi:hypothetical protein